MIKSKIQIKNKNKHWTFFKLLKNKKNLNYYLNNKITLIMINFRNLSKVIHQLY